MKERSKILLIIPAYNEAENIEDHIRNLIQNYPQYDYVVINDCSTDRTEEICRRNGFNFISQPVNLGIGGTVQCGYLYATEKGYDIAVQVDGDGQHDPAYIETIIEPLMKEQADMVIGSRFIEKNGFQSSSMRRVGIQFLCSVIKFICKISITDATSGFRATNKRLTAFFANEYAYDYPEPEAIVSACLSGFKIQERPVLMRERAGGVSSISRLKSVYYMLKVTMAIVICRLNYSKRRSN